MNNLGMASDEAKRYENYVKVKLKLLKQYLTIKEAEDMTGISRAKINYWDSQEMRLSEDKETNKKSWRRFSIVDLIGIRVINDLRNMGIQLSEVYEKLFAWLKANLTSYQLICTLSEGNSIILYFDERTIKHFYGTDTRIWEEEIMPLKRPATLIRLDNIMRETLKKIRTDDFFVKFSLDRFGITNKANYFVDDEHILLCDDTTKINFTIG